MTDEKEVGGGEFSETKKKVYETLRKSFGDRLENMGADPYYLALRMFYAYSVLKINEMLQEKRANPDSISIADFTVTSK